MARKKSDRDGPIRDAGGCRASAERVKDDFERTGGMRTNEPPVRSPAPLSHQVLGEDGGRWTGFAAETPMRFAGGGSLPGRQRFGILSRIEFQLGEKALHALAQPALGTRSLLVQPQEEGLDLCFRQLALVPTSHRHSRLNRLGNSSPPRKVRALLSVPRKMINSCAGTRLPRATGPSQANADFGSLQPAPNPYQRVQYTGFPRRLSTRNSDDIVSDRPRQGKGVPGRSRDFPPASLETRVLHRSDVMNGPFRPPA